VLRRRQGALHCNHVQVSHRLGEAAAGKDLQELRRASPWVGDGPSHGQPAAPAIKAALPFATQLLGPVTWVPSLAPVKPSMDN
jgi:hypothetical protein